MLLHLPKKERMQINMELCENAKILLNKPYIFKRRTLTLNKVSLFKGEKRIFIFPWKLFTLLSVISTFTKYIIIRRQKQIETYIKLFINKLIKVVHCLCGGGVVRFRKRNRSITMSKQSSFIDSLNYHISYSNGKEFLGHMSSSLSQMKWQ